MKKLIVFSSRRYLAGVVNIFLIIVKSYTYVYKKIYIDFSMHGLFSIGTRLQYSFLFIKLNNA